MNYNSMIVTFWFEEFNDFKSVQNPLYEHMKEYFSPFNLTGVPSNVDPLVPRIISTTLGGHTTFNMTKVNVQLQTRFNNEFTHDFQKCIDYVKEKATKVYEILTNICSLKILYMAVVVNCEYETENPVDRIKTELFDKEKFCENNYQEMGIKFSSIVEDKFYSITCINDAKVISFTKKVEPGKVASIVLPLISQREVNIDKKIISFVTEINDRYGFDTIEDYKTDQNIMNKIFDICSDNINKLSENLKQGKLL